MLGGAHDIAPETNEVKSISTFSGVHGSVDANSEDICAGDISAPGATRGLRDKDVAVRSYASSMRLDWRLRPGVPHGSSCVLQML